MYEARRAGGNQYRLLLAPPLTVLDDPHEDNWVATDEFGLATAEPLGDVAAHDGYEPRAIFSSSKWRPRRPKPVTTSTRWRAAAFTARTFERLAAQLDKGQALDRRWTIIGLFISAVLRGSVTGRDPQAPSTLWIMIIRQHWRNSMLHSASCLELVLLVTLRWYVIPSALGNHHTNQTRRNDRHNRHRRGPAAPTPPRPPRTLTQPEVGAQPIRSKRQARVGEALVMPGAGAASSTRRASTPYVPD